MNCEMTIFSHDEYWIMIPCPYKNNLFYYSEWSYELFGFMGNNLVETIIYSDFAEYSNHTCIILNYEVEGLPRKRQRQHVALTQYCWRAGTVRVPLCWKLAWMFHVPSVPLSTALPDLPYCLCPGLSLKKVFLKHFLLRVGEQSCWPQRGSRTQAWMVRTHSGWKLWYFLVAMALCCILWKGSNQQYFISRGVFWPWGLHVCLEL